MYFLKVCAIICRTVSFIFRDILFKKLNVFKIKFPLSINAVTVNDVYYVYKMMYTTNDTTNV